MCAHLICIRQKKRPGTLIGRDRVRENDAPDWIGELPEREEMRRRSVIQENRELRRVSKLINYKEELMLAMKSIKFLGWNVSQILV